MQTAIEAATIMGVTTVLAPMLLAAVLAGDGNAVSDVSGVSGSDQASSDQASANSRALDLQFATKLTGRDGDTAGDIKVEGGAVQLGLDLEGRHADGDDDAKARVELAVSTRVAALSLRF